MPASYSRQSDDSMDRIAEWLSERKQKENETRETPTVTERRATRRAPASNQDRRNVASGSWRSKAKTAKRAPAKKTGAKGTEYKVRYGDTLYSISRRHYGSSAGWKKIYQANRGQLQSPDLLKEGLVLNIPR